VAVVVPHFPQARVRFDRYHRYHRYRYCLRSEGVLHLVHPMMDLKGHEDDVGLAIDVLNL